MQFEVSKLPLSHFCQTGIDACGCWLHLIDFDKAVPADFVRDGFSALALDSYPEAYAEFNQLMLAFIYPEVAMSPSLRSRAAPRLPGNQQQYQLWLNRTERPDR
jgi:hypothetical protein